MYSYWIPSSLSAARSWCADPNIFAGCGWADTIPIIYISTLFIVVHCAEGPWYFLPIVALGPQPLSNLRVMYATAMSMESAGRWAEQGHVVTIRLLWVIDPVDYAYCYGQLNCYSRPFGGEKAAKTIWIGLRWRASSNSWQEVPKLVVYIACLHCVAWSSNGSVFCANAIWMV